MIETDIKVIKQHHQKTSKSLKVISDWQTNHEKEDNKHFSEINEAIKELPNAAFIAKAVTDAVQITVNGKIDKVSAHLIKQDEDTDAIRRDIKTLSDKIKPLDGAKTWLTELAKIIMYLGGLAIAIAGIIELLRMMGILN